MYKRRVRWNFDHDFSVAAFCSASLALALFQRAIAALRASLVRSRGERALRLFSPLRRPRDVAATLRNRLANGEIRGFHTEAQAQELITKGEAVSYELPEAK